MAKNTPIPALFLAAGGFVMIIMERNWQPQRQHAQRMQRAERIQIVEAFTLFFVAAVLFSAAEPPHPERRVTLREAHIPIAVAMLLSAFVFARLPRVTALQCGLGVILGIYGSYRFVQRETFKPENCLGYELARYLDRNAGPNDDVLIMATPISPAILNFYLERARENGDERGFRAAQYLLATMDTTPLDFQRTLIHSRLGRNRLLPYPQLPKKADWVAVWDDFVPFERRTAEWLPIVNSPPTAVVRSLDRAVNISLRLNGSKLAFGIPQVMPVSDYRHIPDVLDAVCQVNPKTILDIGIGFGRWGILCREVLEVYNQRLQPETWVVQIDGLEIHRPYRNPLWEVAYNRVHIGNAFEIVGSLGRYDLILSCDLIEHFDKEIGSLSSKNSATKVIS